MSTAARRLGISTAMAGLLAGVASAQGISDGPNNGGGLQLRLQRATDEADKVSPSRFEVVFDNIGEQDLNVKLGYSLANGKSHHPSALRLVVKSAEGKSRTLRFRETGVAGRLDPYVVPLPTGGSYVLRLRFEQFADPQSGAPFAPAEKETRIAVELAGEAVTRQEANPDTPGLALIRYWLGKARSNELRLPLAANPPR